MPRALLHVVVGRSAVEQTHVRVGSAGAFAGGPRLALVVDGIRLRQPTDLHQV